MFYDGDGFEVVNVVGVVRKIPLITHYDCKVGKTQKKNVLGHIVNVVGFSFVGVLIRYNCFAINILNKRNSITFVVNFTTFVAKDNVLYFVVLAVHCNIYVLRKDVFKGQNCSLIIGINCGLCHTVVLGTVVNVPTPGMKLGNLFVNNIVYRMFFVIHDFRNIL